MRVMGDVRRGKGREGVGLVGAYYLHSGRLFRAPLLCCRPCLVLWQRKCKCSKENKTPDSVKYVFGQEWFSRFSVMRWKAFTGLVVGGVGDLAGSVLARDFEITTPWL